MHDWFAPLAMGVSLCASGSSLGGAPAIAPDYAPRLTLETAGLDTGMITQMAWGPDGALYASRHTGGAVRFVYDPVLGTVGGSTPAAATPVNGTGIAFRFDADPDKHELYLTRNNGDDTYSIVRLSDENHNGMWGETSDGETDVAIVTDLPIGFHPVTQLQIQGNTLFVGIGIVTSDGGTGTWPARPDGESALGGTIAWIQDLTLVPSTTDAAGTLGPLSTATIQTDATPFTSTSAAHLTVHSAGTRNPYGLAFDQSGALFFTNNYHRATTNGDGTSTIIGPNDALGPDFSTNVHDQFFRAVAGADYGFRNDNWRGVRDAGVIAAILDPALVGHDPRRSITPDNLWTTDRNYLQFYDPSASVGLGPHSSADGFAFWYAPALPPGLEGAAFITRWTSSVSEVAPGLDTLTYRDLVAVDPRSGDVARIAEDFIHPLAAIVDPAGRMLVADFGNFNGTGSGIYALTALPPSGDADDSIPTPWRVAHFGHPFASASDESRGGDDPDGDGATNEAEYQAGTNPHNPLSRFAIESVTVTGADIVVTFSTRIGHVYQLRSAPSLDAEVWNPVGGAVSGTGGIVTVTDPGAALALPCFYRVEASVEVP